MLLRRKVLYILVICHSFFLQSLFLKGKSITRYNIIPKMSSVDINLKTNFGSRAIRGNLSDIEGDFYFSFSNPLLSRGQISLDARKLRFGYPKVNVDAHDSEWLNSSKFPKISFILASIDNLSWRDAIMVADVNGNLTIKETSIPVVIPIQVRYLRAERRKYDGENGDILHLTGQFSLSRGQFGINSGSALDSILDSLTVRVQLVAGSQTVRPFLPGRLFASQN